MRKDVVENNLKDEIKKQQLLTYWLLGPRSDMLAVKKWCFSIWIFAPKYRNFYLFVLPSSPPSAQNSNKACLKAKKVWVGGVDLNCPVFSKFAAWSCKSKHQLRQFPKSKNTLFWKSSLHLKIQFWQKFTFILILITSWKQKCALDFTFAYFLSNVRQILTFIFAK